MIKNLIVLICLSVAMTAYGFETMPDNRANKIADAIFKIENSVKYPYGIKSVDCHGDANKARAVCIRTIKNNYIRWQKAGCTNNYIDFLGSVYCPTSGNLSPAEKRLNKNWVGNLKKILTD